MRKNHLLCLVISLLDSLLQYSLSNYIPRDLTVSCHPRLQLSPSCRKSTNRFPLVLQILLGLVILIETGYPPSPSIQYPRSDRTLLSHVATSHHMSLTTDLAMTVSKDTLDIPLGANPSSAYKYERR
jgi:hypothetical protein